MGALRSIIKGEQLVSLSVLTKCELFLRQRFPDFHEITFVQKPLKDFTEEEKHFTHSHLVPLLSSVISERKRVLLEHIEGYSVQLSYLQSLAICPVTTLPSSVGILPTLHHTIHT